MSSAVERAFRKHFSELVKAIDSPADFAHDFYQEELISEESRDAASEVGNTRVNAQKAANLLSAVQKMVKIYPDKVIRVFLSHDTTKHLGSKIAAEAGIVVNEDEDFKEEADFGRGEGDFNGREEEGPNTLRQKKDEDSQLQHRQKGQPQNPPKNQTQPTPAQGKPSQVRGSVPIKTPWVSIPLPKLDAKWSDQHPWLAAFIYIFTVIGVCALIAWVTYWFSRSNNSDH